MYKDAKNHFIKQFFTFHFSFFIFICNFAAAKHGKVLYGMLLVNPPGLDRSKGSRS